MFKGFFNYDIYDEPEKFLSPGEQTQPFLSIDELQKNIGNIEKGSDLLKVVDYIYNNLRYENLDSIDQFGRTSKEIWHSGFFTGCTDFALIFETFARQLGIPTIHLQMISFGWLWLKDRNKTDRMIIGHNACECYINGEWCYVDPINRRTIGKRYNKEDDNIQYQYLVYAKSTDVFETGIYSLKGNNDVIEKLYKERWKNVC